MATDCLIFGVTSALNRCSFEKVPTLYPSVANVNTRKDDSSRIIFQGYAIERHAMVVEEVLPLSRPRSTSRNTHKWVAAAIEGPRGLV
jgi:hypothetical protein